MKHLLATFLLIVPALVYGQDYLPEFDKYSAEYNFDWRGFESQDKYETIAAFTGFIEQNGLLETERQMLKLLKSNLVNSLKAVDINNDSLTDIIYFGPHEGEGVLVHIFIQENRGFRKVFTTSQGIVKVLWADGRIDKLLVHDWGCCADRTLSNFVYQAKYTDNIPTFSLVWQSIELTNFLTKPKHYFETPIRFGITAENYNLRANPFIDDTTENHLLEIKGNSIGILKKGFKGTAYASTEDNTGRIWWYVIIDKEFEVEQAYIHYPYYKFKPHLVGWISNRYVVEL